MRICEDGCRGFRRLRMHNYGTILRCVEIERALEQY